MEELLARVRLFVAWNEAGMEAKFRELSAPAAEEIRGVAGEK